jgi:hypothetical protein
MFRRPRGRLVIFQVAADIAHDFERSGGVKEELTAELRLTK